MTFQQRLPAIHFRNDCSDAMPFRFRGDGALPCVYLAGMAADTLAIVQRLAGFEVGSDAEAGGAGDDQEQTVQGVELTHCRSLV